MPDWVWGALPIVLGGLLGAWWRRTYRSWRRGRTSSFVVTFSGAGAPYPGRPVRGVLVLTADAMQLEQASGRVLDLSATGLRALRRREPALDEYGAHEDPVALVCQDGVGTAVTVVAPEDTIEALATALADRPLPGRPEPVRESDIRRNPLLGAPLALIVAGAVLGLLSAALLITATSVTGTVRRVDPEDGYCRLAWHDARAGLDRVTAVDCRRKAGEPARAIALGPPFTGVLIDTDTPPAWLIGSGLVALCGVALAGYRAWAWRRPLPSLPATTGTRPAPAAELGAGDLHWAAISAAARARADAEGWNRVDDATHRRGARRQWTCMISLASGPALVVALALGMCWTSFAGVLSEFGPRERAVAQVGDVDEFPLVLPDDLTVTFTTASGQRVTTLVAVTGKPDTAEIAVRYSVAHPVRATAVGHDGHRLGAGLGLLAILAAVVGSAWYAGGFVRSARAQRRALAAGPEHRVRYAALLDDEADLVLLIFADGPAGPANGRPQFAVLARADDRGLVPAAGEATVHGPFEAGTTVALTLAGRRLPLRSPLLEIDPEDLLLLLNDDGLTL